MPKKSPGIVSPDAEQLIDEFLRLHVRIFSSKVAIGWREKMVDRRHDLRRDAELLLRAADGKLPVAKIVQLIERAMEDAEEPPASPLFVADEVRKLAAAARPGRPTRTTRPSPGRVSAPPSSEEETPSVIALAGLMTAADYRALSGKARGGGVMSQGEAMRYAAYVKVWRRLHFCTSRNPVDRTGALHRPELETAAERVLFGLFPAAASRISRRRA